MSLRHCCYMATKMERMQCLGPPGSEIHDALLKECRRNQEILNSSGNVCAHRGGTYSAFWSPVRLHFS